MPGLSNFLKLALLNEAFYNTRYTPANSGGTATVYAQLHTGPAGPNCTAFPANDTQRALIALGAPALQSGWDEQISTADVVFANFQTVSQNNPDTLTDYSLWDSPSGGNPLGRGPLGGFNPVACSALASTSIVTSAASGFANGDLVEVYREVGGDFTGTNLVEDTRYWTGNCSGPNFQLFTNADLAIGHLQAIGVDCNFRVIRAIPYAVNFGQPVKIPSGQFVVRAA